MLGPRIIACTPNLLVISFSGMDCLTIPMQMTRTLYMTMDHSNNDWRDGLARIELCVSEIREWMKQNMLKLNDDKTELIVFTSKYKQDLYNDLSRSVTLWWIVVHKSRIWGVIFDRVLSLRQHVSYTSKGVPISP